MPPVNGIGQFIIGVSPIGTIPPFEVLRTVISQYANSPTLLQLIENMDGYLGQTRNFDEFFDLIWNVDTAQGYGLDVWGRIVGVGRILEVNAGEYFDFQESGVDGRSFNEAPFYIGAPLTSNYALTDTAYRRLILAKALANICDGSIPAINQILLNLFPNRGDCYVMDGQDMTMVYAFAFVLSPVESAIVTKSGVLPTPTGVSYTVAQGV